MPRQLIEMTHPDAGTGRATLAAFHKIWERKGWVLAGKDTTPAALLDPDELTPPDPSTNPDAGDLSADPDSEEE